MPTGVGHGSPAHRRARRDRGRRGDDGLGGGEVVDDHGQRHGGRRVAGLVRRDRRDRHRAVGSMGSGPQRVPAPAEAVGRIRLRPRDRVRPVGIGPRPLHVQHRVGGVGSEVDRAAHVRAGGRRGDRPGGRGVVGDHLDRADHRDVAGPVGHDVTDVVDAVGRLPPGSHRRPRGEAVACACEERDRRDPGAGVRVVGGRDIDRSVDVVGVLLTRHRYDAGRGAIHGHAAAHGPGR